MTAGRRPTLQRVGAPSGAPRTAPLPISFANKQASAPALLVVVPGWRVLSTTGDACFSYAPQARAPADGFGNTSYRGAEARGWWSPGTTMAERRSGCWIDHAPTPQIRPPRRRADRARGGVRRLRRLR